MERMQTEERYTYQDYLSWPEGEQIELVDPEERVAEVHIFDEAGRHDRRSAYGPEETVTAAAVQDLALHLRLVFPL